MSLPYLSTAGVGFGSVIITPTSGNASGVSFIAETSDPVAPTAQTFRTTELGAPNGTIGFAERRTWRGTLQIATNSTAHPDVGDEFTLARTTTNAGSVNVNYWFTELGEPKAAREFWKIEAQALEKA